MSDSKPPLPDFAEPPVIETLLGVQFAPLPLAIPHFGLYWATIRDRLPKCETHPPMGPAVEEFGTQPTAPTIGIELVSQPEVRCWFINELSNKLIQVQRDRFIQNWRKVSGNEIYPRYKTLKPTFVEEWNGFCGFLNGQKLGSPDVNQCEVTYVNHIELGLGWHSYGEISKVIANWTTGNPVEFLPSPEVVRLNTRYLMPDKKGRLHITVQPGLRRTDMKEVLQLTLTARGRPASSRIEDILDWFDMGHEWIVRGFTDFTTPDMHSIWGRKA